MAKTDTLPTPPAHKHPCTLIYSFAHIALSLPYFLSPPFPSPTSTQTPPHHTTLPTCPDPGPASTSRTLHLPYPLPTQAHQFSPHMTHFTTLYHGRLVLAGRYHQPNCVVCFYSAQLHHCTPEPHTSPAQCFMPNCPMPKTCLDDIGTDERCNLAEKTGVGQGEGGSQATHHLHFQIKSHRKQGDTPKSQ